MFCSVIYADVIYDGSLRGIAVSEGRADLCAASQRSQRNKQWRLETKEYVDLFH